MRVIQRQPEHTVTIAQLMRLSQQSEVLAQSTAAGSSSARTREFRIVRPGTLRARCRPLWVTRRGDPDDHVIAAGGALRLLAGDRVVLGALHDGESAAWQWWPDRTEKAGQPAQRRRPASRLAGVGGGVSALSEVVLGALADVLERGAVRARSAASSASRAHGAMRSADSIASSGALE